MKKPLLALSIIIISGLHYLSPLHAHHLHAIYQRLYYIPVILAAYLFGPRWGIGAALFCGISYAPHIFFQWGEHPTSFSQYVEIPMFVVIGGLVGILSDIQRKQHRQIQVANEQIRRMDRLSLLGQLAAGLAHEIRNPLGSLIGSAEILKETVPPEHPKHEFVDILDKELKRLRDKLNEFLRFARPSPVSVVPNNLNDVVKAAVDLVSKQASGANVAIETHRDERLPLAPMDSEQLKQVLLNLLLNAVDAMPRGGRIIVSTWEEPSWIGFSVQDEGSGIPEPERDKIFQPFYTTKEEGTGLGLAIVKQFVDSMKGTVCLGFTSKGARFEVRIPYDENTNTAR